MLTLTRRPHEEIVVIDTQTGERIVAAVRCQGNEMRIGIEATERFRILRRELVEEGPCHSE